MCQDADKSIAGWVKLDLLSRGIQIDSTLPRFLEATKHFALRKNFYNDPVWGQDSSRLPQEISVLGSVVGINCYGNSPWSLKYSREQENLVLSHKSGAEFLPDFIPDLRAFEADLRVARVANLYGGAALAFFSPRSCYFFADRSECHFCSLAGTAEENHTFESILSQEDVRMSVRLALQKDPDRIEQIMIVGGNLRDLDRGFEHHLTLAEAAEIELRSSRQSQNISIHIATMPPRNLDLVERLRGFENIHVMFNVEIWDAKRFEEMCPGKSKDYGRLAMLKALEKLRDVVGPYRAHSLLVTGLDGIDSTIEGATVLTKMGISPILNIFHSDRHSRLGLSIRPTFGDLSKIALALQELYTQFPVMPYWRNCGRNSIDAEAERKLFEVPTPSFLSTPCTN